MIDDQAVKPGPGFEIGTQIGPSAWVAITQPMIDGFAKDTIDPDPFHIDPAWCKDNSPYSTTIAFGFLTISLLTHLMHSAQGDAARDTAADPAIHGHYLNYGFNRLRLISPVLVDKRVRGHFTIKNIEVDEKGRNMVMFDCMIEIEDEERPALVAQWLAVWVPGQTSA